MDLNKRDHLKRLQHHYENRLLGRRVWNQAEKVGRLYCKHLWESGAIGRILQDPTVKSQFHVALSLDSRTDYSVYTKRAALITDTLLLSDEISGRRNDPQMVSHYEQGTFQQTLIIEEYLGYDDDYNSQFGFQPGYSRDISVLARTPARLGEWLGGAKPLVSSGAVWFLPNYYISDRYLADRAHPSRHEPTRPLDFLIRAGRAVEMSGVHPVKSRMVRPIIELEIPVIEGTSLRDFSEITLGEFNSFAAFRDFLRLRMLELDPAMNSVDSQVELTKIGLEISDQVRSLNSQLRQVRTKRAVQVTGAAIGTVGAVLLGVYGPALQGVVTAIGASAGLWGGITAAAENSTKPLRDDKWYYVWALSKKIDLV
ncbi:hypothetical protein AB0N88_33150 [Streptomyces sp. NPDC093516]|uniref:glycine zipper family protein n=1 Tax=Streptomyces sp. NPDC093516 TaxID=3155304 RepID=UPI0034294830